MCDWHASCSRALGLQKHPHVWIYLFVYGLLPGIGAEAPAASRRGGDRAFDVDGNGQVWSDTVCRSLTIRFRDALKGKARVVCGRSQRRQAVGGDGERVQEARCETWGKRPAAASGKIQILGRKR